MLSWSIGIACRAGCAWARRSPCRWASPWAPVPRCGARITRGSGQPHFTLTGSRRLDRTSTFSISILNRAFTLFRFSPQLALIHEARQTNAQAQNFERNRAELRFVRQF